MRSNLTLQPIEQSTHYKNKKRLLILLIVVFCLAFLTFNLPRLKENNQNKAVLNNETQIVLFYRSDCPACHKIFKNFYWQSKFNFKKVTYVNLVNEQNRHFITQFKLNQVPTFIKINKGHIVRTYSGTSRSKIKKISEKW